MKILTRKQQNKILKRLAANQIIIFDAHISVESDSKFLENTLDIAYLIDGFCGMDKVYNTASKWLREGKE